MKMSALVDVPVVTEETAANLSRFIAGRPSADLNAAYYAGKTAAVTCGASGAGLALAEKLLECGAKKVVLADFNRENLDKHVARLSARYPDMVKGIQCDISDEESVKSMITDAHEFFADSFDLLINCAGIAQKGLFVAPPDSDIVQQKTGLAVESQERWDRIFADSFYGPLYACRAVLPIMLAQKSGQVVNVISGACFTGMGYQFIYASSNAALNLLTLSLRYEYWDTGVRFNSATAGTMAAAISGHYGTPLNARTPEQTALRILTGAAKNDRLICGDDNDVYASMTCYNVKASKALDKVFMEYAKADHDGRKIN